MTGSFVNGFESMGRPRGLLAISVTVPGRSPEEKIHQAEYSPEELEHALRSPAGRGGRGRAPSDAAPANALDLRSRPGVFREAFGWCRVKFVRQPGTGLHTAARRNRNND